MSNCNQKGKELFDSGLYCAESVLKVIAKEENIAIDDDDPEHIDHIYVAASAWNQSIVYSVDYDNET